MKKKLTKKQEKPNQKVVKWTILLKCCNVFRKTLQEVFVQTLQKEYSLVFKRRIICLDLSDFFVVRCTLLEIWITEPCSLHTVYLTFSRFLRPFCLEVAITATAVNLWEKEKLWCPISWEWLTFWAFNAGVKRKRYPAESFLDQIWRTKIHCEVRNCSFNFYRQMFLNCFPRIVTRVYRQICWKMKTWLWLFSLPRLFLSNVFSEFFSVLLVSFDLKF